jgi:hypothetical protein
MCVITFLLKSGQVEPVEVEAVYLVLFATKRLDVRFYLFYLSQQSMEKLSGCDKVRIIKNLECGCPGCV